jgi:hypothetical protein
MAARQCRRLRTVRLLDDAARRISHRRRGHEQRSPPHGAGANEHQRGARFPESSLGTAGSESATPRYATGGRSCSVIKFSIDPRQLVKDMNDVGERQIPFAMMKTLNNTAEDVQAEQQEHIARKFTLRRPTFILNTVKINRGDFATKDNLRAIVRIDPDRDVLSKFEDEGRRRRCSLVHAIAIPIEAKRSKNDIVANNMRPRALQLTQIFLQRRSKNRRRTEANLHDSEARWIRRDIPTSGPWQRSSIHLLFKLKVTVPLPKSLQVRGECHAHRE